MNSKERILLFWMEENNSHNTRIFFIETDKEEAKKYIAMADKCFRYDSFDQDEEPEKGTIQHEKWKLWSLLQWADDAERLKHGITEFEDKVIFAGKLLVDYVIKMHKVE